MKACNRHDGGAIKAIAPAPVMKKPVMKKEARDE